MGFNPHPDANQISALLGGELRGPARQQLLHHLSGCAACREWAACTQLASGREDGWAQPAAPPVRAWNGAWRLLPPVLAAGVVLAASGLWMQRASLAPAVGPATATRQSSPVPAPRRAAALHPAPAAANHAPAAAVGPTPSARSKTALAALDQPAKPALPESEFQPSVDFSPLTTGFQDQAPVRVLQPQLAQLSAPAPALAASAPSVAAQPVAATARSTPFRRVNTSPFQQAFATSPTTPAFSRSLAPSAPSALGWAISRSGEVLHSVGAGIWTAVPLLPGVHVHTLFASGALLWAGGAAGELFVSHDRGAHWRHVTLPDSGAQASVSHIRFSDPQHGLVALANGHTWRTSDGGATWQPAAAH